MWLGDWRILNSHENPSMTIKTLHSQALNIVLFTPSVPSKIIRVVFLREIQLRSVYLLTPYQFGATMEMYWIFFFFFFARTKYLEIQTALIHTSDWLLLCRSSCWGSPVLQRLRAVRRAKVVVKLWFNWHTDGIIKYLAMTGLLHFPGAFSDVT